MEQIPVAILSFAHPHARFWGEAFSRSPVVDLVAVWDDDSDRGKQGAAHCETQYINDLDQLLTDAQIRAVAVCSETRDHERLVTAAATHGKDVLCEKPTATNVAVCDRLLAVYNKCQARYVQSFPQRLDPSNHRVKELIAEGAIGRVITARKRHGHPGVTLGWFAPKNMHWFLDRKASGGGALLDEGVHAADLLRWLFGEPISVMAQIEHSTPGLDVEDNGIATYRFESGLRATLEASWTCLASTVTLEVYGTHGVIIQQGNDCASTRVGGETVPRLLLHRRGREVDCWELEFDGTDFFSSLHHRMALGFADLLTGKSVPAATLEDGRQAVAMIEAAYQSSRRCETIGIERVTPKGVVS